jgi:PTS system mannose-specific IIA component
MFGGTATNVALPFLVPDRIEIVTGVNLPMLVKLGSLRGQDLPLGEIAQRLTAAAQKSIRVASEFLRSKNVRVG